MKKQMKKAGSVLLCALLLLGIMVTPLSASAAALPYTDVPTSSPYYEPIMYVTDFGLMGGTSPTTFSPAKELDRGTFITVLGRLAEQLGEVIQNNYTTPFTDVPANAFYSKYVGWAWSHNIVNGTTPTTFSPKKTINRQEMAVMTYNYCNYMGITLSVIDDLTYLDISSVSSWAVAAVNACGRASVILPFEDNRWLTAGEVFFEPKEKATRAVCAETIYNLVSIHIS